MAMKQLAIVVQKLERNRKARALVNTRLCEFKAMQSKPSKELFKELCFCIMTANFDAAKSIKVQENVCNGFIELPGKKLEAKLRELGYRYPNRAEYICNSRKHLKQLKQKISSSNNESSLREWLVNNVKGLGLKEASHFLRNIGFNNLAIIDFHIVDLLARYKLIKKPKTMTREKYLAVEKVLEKLAKKLKMSLAELDLYLWFLETGKVLK